MDTESYIPSLPQIDPNILGIVIGVVLLGMIVLLFFFIPRVSTIHDLQTKLSRAESERDYAREQWSIDRSRANKAEENLKNQVKDAENRKRQADDKAEQISTCYDKLRRQSNYELVTYKASCIKDEEYLNLCNWDFGVLDDVVLREFMIDFFKKAKEDGLFRVTRTEDRFKQGIEYEFKIDILKEK